MTGEDPLSYLKPFFNICIDAEMIKLSLKTIKCASLSKYLQCFSPACEVSVIIQLSKSKSLKKEGKINKAVSLNLIAG